MATTSPPRKLRFIKRGDPTPNSALLMECVIGFGDTNLIWSLLKELGTAEQRGERSLENTGLVRDLHRIILMEQRGETLSN